MLLVSCCSILLFTFVGWDAWDAAAVLSKTKDGEIGKKLALSTLTLPTAVLKCIQMYTTNNANANTHTNTNAHTNILKTHMFKEKQPMWLKLNALQRTFPFIAGGWGGVGCS